MSVRKRYANSLSETKENSYKVMTNDIDKDDDDMFLVIQII